MKGGSWGTNGLFFTTFNKCVAIEIHTQSVLTVMSVLITHFDSLWVKGGIPLYHGKFVP